MSSGVIAIVLHAHLPFVHHPEYESFYEERWLFSAMTECYLPLVEMLDRLDRDHIEFHLTLSISPTLLSMWQSPLLQTRYLQYLQGSLELAQKEIVRTRDLSEYHALAQFYEERFHTALNTYRDHYQCDLLAAFIKHQQKGKLELITTAATHGFLPLLNTQEAVIRSQIKIGLDCFSAATGIQPQGLWLPECGYYPGLENILKDYGVKYFFMESHGLTHAEPAVATAVYAAVDAGNGVAAFGRDPATSKQVWSAQHGYPGDADYREYHRDIGFELELDYLAPYLPNNQLRCHTGFKYQRVTGGDQIKAVYRPEQALHKARLHAEHFIDGCRQQLQVLNSELSDIEPIIVAPYDAELFGHWWYEGPHWLEAVLRLAAHPAMPLRTTDCRRYLQARPPGQTALLAASSWGDQGYSGFWLNDSNSWIYPLIHKAAADLEKLVKDLRGKAVNDLQQRTLNQALRCLLLAQASDWPFILKAGGSEDFARQNVTDHLARFNYLYDSIRKNAINERYLSALEIMDDIFPDLDFRDFQS